MENKPISAEELKSLYFQNESKLFSKNTKKQDFHIKSTTEILSNIAQVNSFKRVKETYRLNLILKKILLQSQLHWIKYAYYKNKKLIIGTSSHIGQSELNMQKYVLLNNFKKIERYSDIEGVSIFRDENIVTDMIKKEKVSDFSERSYGIFDNYLKDEKQYQIVENIKKNIRNVKL